MENALIRKCTHNDIDAILQLDREWYEENIAYDFFFINREEYIAYLEHSPSYFWVAEIDGCVIGYINASTHVNKNIRVISQKETYLEIENIYVSKEFRNENIGGKLIDKILEVAEQNGIQRFLVSSDSKDMDKVMRFYQSHGFKPCNIQLFK